VNNSTSSKTTEIATWYANIIPKIDSLLDKTDNVLREQSAVFEGEKNPSTQLDKEIDSLLNKGLKEILDIPFFSEETPDIIRECDMYWIVDAIDGTLNAIVNNENFVTAIALVETKSKNASISVISAPILRTRISAGRTLGCKYNNNTLSRKKTTQPKILAYGLPADADVFADTFGEKLVKLVKNDWILRQTGSAALDISRVALGQWIGYYQQGIYIWDTVGAELIATELGLDVFKVRYEYDNDPYRFDILVAQKEYSRELKAVLMDKMDV
jgi:fructose-1,6-bisphosphatase/inositol monophosphatase family enzyme